jgi:hypothetical protein
MSSVKTFAAVCRQPMRPIPVLALLIFISSLSPVRAQTLARFAGPPSYDIRQEVTLNGTVSSVLLRPASGMIVGSHLRLATLSGPVDASLGRFALVGKGALSLAPGQQVEVTGVMMTIRDEQVFLARTVRAGGETYTIRNERGIPISPLTRERLTHKIAGGTL